MHTRTTKGSEVRILFWGTPDFAVPPLAALLGESYDVVGVVTQPDRPVGRDRVLTPPPVKALAEREGIEVLQPLKPRGDDFEAWMRRLAPDLSIVVAYGHILPRSVIDLPRLGTLNIHASLLPRWRGAAPIEASILAGDDETGVCIMRMVQALDAGPVLHVRRTPILPDETGGELRLRLSELGAEALLETLPLIEQSIATEHPQDETHVTYAPKIERESARVDFAKDAVWVVRAIRGYDPKPGPWTTLRGVAVKVYGARAVPDAKGVPGMVLEVREDGMLVACAHGAVRIAYVHAAGNRRMAALDWHQRKGISIGDVLGT